MRVERPDGAGGRRGATRRGVLIGAAAVALALGAPADAAWPPGPRDGTPAAAVREGKVVVYSPTDQAVIAPLLEDFAALHPEIAVEYHDLNTRELHERFLGEVGSRAPTADVLWSPAMDLQMKLANDGYAQIHESAETARLPASAVWRNEAFGTTLEPVVFIHHRRLLPPAEVPKTHAELARWLESGGGRLRGRVGTYDPERSATGYLLLTQDSRIDPSFAETLRAYARAELALHRTSGEMIERVAAGDVVLAFNVNAAYAHAATRGHPDLAIVYPKDYVLAISRIALIPKAAAHPNAARVFLDHLLSRRGQEALARSSALFSVRTDVAGERSAAFLRATLGARLKPIHVGPSLLVFLDAAKRADFLRRWRDAPSRR